MNIKKKIVSLLLCGAMTLSFAGCNNSDKETKETTKKPTKENVWITDHESFKYLETFGYELVNCDEKATGEVVIPKGIKEISSGSFMVADDVTKIVFQEGVQYIYDTFSWLYKLEEVILPDSLLYMEYPLFKNPDITITYKGEKYTYSDIEKLYIKINSQEIPKPTEPDFLIDNGVLGRCRNNGFSEVVVPDEVKIITIGSFLRCDENIKRIILPDRLEKAVFKNLTNAHAFNSFYDITVVFKGKEYKSTDGFEKLFLEINGYNTIEPTYEVSNGVLMDIGYDIFSSVCDYTLPDDVKYVWGYRDTANQTIKNLTVPEGVLYIGNDFLCNAKNLEKVNLPDSLKYISENCFKQCENAIFTYKGKDYNHSQLSALIDLINSNGVADATEPIFLIIEENILFGGSLIDYALLGFNDIVIPDNVYEISSNVFKDCTDLKKITIAESVYEIGYSAFENCTGLTNVTIPYGVRLIGSSAFLDCTNLKNITIAESVYEIGPGAFGNCTGLTNVTIPYGVKSIESSTFENCTSLTNVTIPDSVTEIGTDAFFGCTSLTNITIPDSVTEIGYDAFFGCTSLTNITIAESVYEIGRGAFRNCTGLTNVTIPYGVESIESSTFENCTSLTNVTIPDSVTQISSRVFKGCTSLTNVTIPDSVTVIGSEAFKDCTSLTNVTIPDMVTLTTDDNAFDGCENINVTYRGKTYTYDNIDELYDAINN